MKHKTEIYSCQIISIYQSKHATCIYVTAMIPSFLPCHYAFKIVNIMKKQNRKQILQQKHRLDVPNHVQE